jgi:hypothetical protein
MQPEAGSTGIRNHSRSRSRNRLRCRSERPSTGRGRAQSGRLIAGFGGTILEKLRRKILKAFIKSDAFERLR